MKVLSRTLNIEVIENAESKILILKQRNKDLGCDLGQLKFDFEEITVKNETLKNINIDLEDKGKFKTCC